VGGTDYSNAHVGIDTAMNLSRDIYYSTTVMEGHPLQGVVQAIPGGFCLVALFFENMVSCQPTKGYTLRYNWDGKSSCARGVVQTIQGGFAGMTSPIVIFDIKRRRHHIRHWPCLK
jgi:hypothetical protein